MHKVKALWCTEPNFFHKKSCEIVDLQYNSQEDPSKTIQNVFFTTLSPPRLSVILLYLYSIHSAICRPSDRTVGRPPGAKFEQGRRIQRQTVDTILHYQTTIPLNLKKQYSENTDYSYTHLPIQMTVHFGKYFLYVLLWSRLTFFNSAWEEGVRNSGATVMSAQLINILLCCVCFIQETVQTEILLPQSFEFLSLLPALFSF